MQKQHNRTRIMRIYERFGVMIESGEKTIEIRVGYSSMKKIKAGDTIRFLVGKRSCDRRVVRVSIYASFDEMMKHEDPHKINPYKSSKDQLDEIKKIFPPDKERLGVLVFELA